MLGLDNDDDKNAEENTHAYSHMENVPKRCHKEKGRDLCLFSSHEYPFQPKSNKLSPSKQTVREPSKIKKKYFTNMYTLSKWSIFVRELYKNDTLNRFCNRLEDGTYILGVPASSKAIESVVLSINLEDNEITNPKQGSVTWVTFNNVIDAMNVANYLKIQDVLDKCGQVLGQTLPIRLGNKTDDRNSVQLKRTCVDKNTQTWSTTYTAKISAIDALKHKHEAERCARYFLAIINYLQNRAFDWSDKPLEVKQYIHALLLAFLSIDLNLLPIEQKLKMFDKYVKKGDAADNTIRYLSMMAFSKNGPAQFHDMWFEN